MSPTSLSLNRGSRYVEKATVYARTVEGLQWTFAYRSSQTRKAGANGRRCFSSRIEKSPSVNFASIRLATACAASLLPIFFALRLPLWSINTHHLPRWTLTLTAMLHVSFQLFL